MKPRSPLKVPYSVSLSSLFPKIQEEKTASLITLCLTLGASALLIVFAIAPTMGTITQLNTSLSDNQFVNSQLETKIQNLSALQKQYDSLSESLPVVYRAIPQSADITVLLGQIQALAQRSALAVIRLQTFPIELPTVKQTTTHSSFVVAVDVQGSYTDVVRFYAALGSFERILTLDTLSIARSSGSTDTVRASIRGTAYFKTL
jgi:Tfp pilus assembly protein PilO